MFFNENLDGRLKFDLVNKSYDISRPSYPSELFNDIKVYANLNSSSKILEIGASADQATEIFIASGYEIDIIEPGTNFMNILKSRYSKDNNTTFIKALFEDAKLSDNKYNLVFAGDSFHWVDKEIGMNKLEKVLMKGASFAASWNLPKFDVNLVRKFEAICSHYVPDYKAM